MRKIPEFSPLMQELSGDIMSRFSSKAYCDHGEKETPSICYCPADCYCREHLCKEQGGYSIADIAPNAALRERREMEIEPVNLEKSPTQMERLFISLTTHYNHHGIFSWLSKPKVELGGRTPSQAIDDGDIKLVVELSESQL